ncbi:hypothetical protein J2X36_004082 [Methylobacterium sp. BE186]|nr:hypothetical protein [Methylobacterium sp. BE186]
MLSGGGVSTEMLLQVDALGISAPAPSGSTAALVRAHVRAILLKIPRLPVASVEAEHV